MALAKSRLRCKGIINSMLDGGWGGDELHTARLTRQSRTTIGKIGVRSHIRRDAANEAAALRR
jgi:hypothetical protein